MELPASFANFLDRRVNLNPTRLSQLEGRVNSIVSYLKNDSVIGPTVLGHQPLGSWAHQTIIKPVDDNDEFDADLLLLLEYDETLSSQPSGYLVRLRQAFDRSSTYSSMTRGKSRCVRVTYANDCHIDVAPAVTFEDGRQFIINSSDNTFESTNPIGFTTWIHERDESTFGQLRKVIRLLKFLRDHKNTFTCPSVILTTLLGFCVDPVAKAKYSSTAKAIVSLLGDVMNLLSLYPEMPRLEDPSCADVTFNHRWTEAQYQNFKRMLSSYARRTAAALDEKNPTESHRLWQDIFGEEFRVSSDDFSLNNAASTYSESIIQPAVAYALSAVAPQEEFIDKKFKYAGGFSATITGRIAKKTGFRHGPIRSFRTVPKDRRLFFEVTTNVPEPYTVFWKVRNSGAEAYKANGLRGQIMDGGSSRFHTETTDYTGRHYVEAYIIKDGYILASDRHIVTIA